MKKDDFIIPESVFFEVYFQLNGVYNFSKPEIYFTLNSLIESKFYIENKDIFNAALEIYKDYNLSLVDSFLCAKAILENKKLETFDKDLKKVYEKLTKS